MNDARPLRGTFDEVAERYDRARPRYPDRLIDEVVSLTGVRAGDRVLEVGCGSGQATRQLSERGLRVTCVELGARLADAARANLALHAGVDVVVGDVETWSSPDGVVFDLVAAATSWHWIAPDLRYRRAWQLLRPGGHLAFWSAVHVLPEKGDPFFAEIQEVYESIGEGLPPGSDCPRPGALPDQRSEVEHTGLFGDVEVHQFDWEIVYTADAYIELLETFSGHIAMKHWQRERLFTEIRRRIGQRTDPRVRRHWGAVLHVARRLER